MIYQQRPISARPPPSPGTWINGPECVRQLYQVWYFGGGESRRNRKKGIPLDASTKHISTGGNKH